MLGLLPNDLHNRDLPMPWNPFSLAQAALQKLQKLQHKLARSLVNDISTDDIIVPALKHRRVMYLGAQTSQHDMLRKYLKQSLDVDLIEEHRQERLLNLVQDYGEHVDLIVLDRDLFLDRPDTFPATYAAIRAHLPTTPVIILRALAQREAWPVSSRPPLRDVILAKPLTKTDIWYGMRLAFLRARPCDE